MPSFQTDSFATKVTLSCLIEIDSHITSFVGAKYKRHASIILPLFRRGKIVSNLDLIVDCMDKLLAKWRTSPTEKVHVDIIE